MSGPKCASYAVEQAALEAARRRRAALDRRAALLSRAQRLEVAASARVGSGRGVDVDLSLAPGSDDGPTEQIERWNREADARLDEAEQRLREAERQEQQAAISRSMLAVSTDDRAAAIRQRAAHAETDAPDDTREPAVRAEELDAARAIEELLASVPAGASESEHAQIRDSLTHLARASATDVPSLIVGAKAQIQAIERSIERRDAERDRARKLHRSLDGLRGSRIDQARVLLDRVIAGDTELLDADVERIDDARQEALAEEKQRYVASQLEEAFRESGYDVDLGFATDVLDGEESYLPARSSGDHAVGLRFRDGTFDVRVVRSDGAPDPERDTEAEVEFCRDLGRVSVDLREAGVVLDLVSHQPAGAVPVAVVQEAHSSRGRRGRSTAPRERSHNR